MKSPFTDKEMALKRELRVVQFRKENFEIMHHHFHCEDSGENFTNTALDEINMRQVFNQYRDKHNLPFPDEIKAVREKYGLSASKMSEILGFGINSYRKYEDGDVPSHANGKLIQLAADPKKFRDLMKISENLNETIQVKILKRLDEIIEAEKKMYKESEVRNYLTNPHLPDAFSGYRVPNLDKIAEMILFFAIALSPWKTQLNKLLFYADFTNFKRTCFSISGLRYRAIKMGPVPEKFNSLFEYLHQNQVINIQEILFDDGNVGERFLPVAGREFQADLFSDEEIIVMEKIASAFKNVGTLELINLSHEESAWKQNEAQRSLIDYALAFELKRF